METPNVSAVPQDEDLNFQHGSQQDLAFYAVSSMATSFLRCT